ncbi:hypothetical protein JCM11491_006152 [Sporobolomyces phaffii]
MEYFWQNRQRLVRTTPVAHGQIGEVELKYDALASDSLADIASVPRKVVYQAEIGVSDAPGAARHNLFHVELHFVLHPRYAQILLRPHDVTRRAEASPAVFQ